LSKCCFYSKTSFTIFRPIPDEARLPAEEDEEGARGGGEEEEEADE
jgi:hypothetical protein